MVSLSHPLLLFDFRFFLLTQSLVATGDDTSGLGAGTAPGTGLAVCVVALFVTLIRGFPGPETGAVRISVEEGLGI